MHAIVPCRHAALGAPPGVAREIAVEPSARTVRSPVNRGRETGSSPGHAVPTVTSPVPRSVWESLLASDEGAVVTQSLAWRDAVFGERPVPGREPALRVPFRSEGGAADGPAAVAAARRSP